MTQLNSVSTTPRSKTLPPKVPGLPLLGNALDMARDPLGFFVQAHQKYGAVYRAQILSREITVLAGLDANLFMTRQGDDVLGSHELFGSFAAELETEVFLVALDGAPHRHLRKGMRAGYSRENFLQHLPAEVALTRATARQWQVGRSFPATRAIQRLVAQQLGLAVTHFNPDAYFDDLWLFLNYILNACVMKMWPRWTLRSPIYQRAKRRVMEMAHIILKHHRENPPGTDRPADLIDDLLKGTTLDGQPLSESALVAATIGPMIAGIDTVASTTSFMLYALLKNPDILERVQAEVDRVFSGDVPDLSALREMPTLHGAALETLRMYPVAFAVPRLATQAFDFGGYTIAAGEEVYVASGVTHYLPTLYANPYVFDVDRYAPTRAEHKKPGAFTAYGLGAHTCLGAGVAEIQIMLTIGVLLRTVRLAMDPPDYTLQQRVTPLPSPAPSFRVKVVEQRK